MAVRIAVASLLALLASLRADESVASEVREAGRMMEAARRQYVIVSTFMTPRKGTGRKEVEEIYGAPLRVASALGESPLFRIYYFGENQCSLEIAYKDGKVSWARWNSLEFLGGPGTPELPLTWESLQRKRAGYEWATASLRVIRRRYWERLRMARWRREWQPAE